MLAFNNQEPQTEARILRPLQEAQAPLPVPRGAKLGSVWSIVVARKWFCAIVVLPTLLSVLYFGLIASDVYMSEARFVVRSGKPVQTSSMSALLQNVGMAPAQDDSLIVVEYVNSRDILRRLTDENEFRRIVGAKNSDFWQRFPRPFSEETFEDLFNAYPRFVRISNDTSTGVATVRVRAFAAEDAHHINEAILTYSEEFVNDLNEQVRLDSINEDAIRAYVCGAPAAAIAMCRAALEMVLKQHYGLDYQYKDPRTGDLRDKGLAEIIVLASERYDFIQKTRIDRLKVNADRILHDYSRIAALSKEDERAVLEFLKTVKYLIQRAPG